MKTVNDAIIMITTVIVAVALVLAMVRGMEALAAEVDPEVLNQIQQNGTAEAIVGYASQVAADAAPAEGRVPGAPYVLRTIDQTDLDTLLLDPEVLTIEANIELDSELVDSVPLSGVPPVWVQGLTGGGEPWGYTGEGQIIAILDSGVDPNHPAFAGKIAGEACFSFASSSRSSVCPNGESTQIGPGAGVPCPQADCFHGTHVAGIAVGNDTTIQGVAKDAEIYSVQVFSYRNSNPTVTTATQFDVLRGFNWLYAQAVAGVNFASINASLGGGFPRSVQCPGSEGSVQWYIEQFRNIGVPTVVSAGNGGIAAVTWPACAPEAISAGSVDKSGVLSAFSNVPALEAFPEYLLSYGEDITSSMPGGGYASQEGTSMAAPHLTGGLALLKQIDPSASVDKLVASLQRTGVSTATPEGVRARMYLDTAALFIQAPDVESDGIPDLWDNCIQDVNGPDILDAGGNSQRDTNGDGYGNACDPDLDNSGLVDWWDGDIFIQFLNDPTLQNYLGVTREDVDFNGDGDVDFDDDAILLRFYYRSPGPKGPM